MWNLFSFKNYETFLKLSTKCYTVITTTNNYFCKENIFIIYKKQIKEFLHWKVGCRFGAISVYGIYNKADSEVKCKHILRMQYQSL